MEHGGVQASPGEGSVGLSGLGEAPSPDREGPPVQRKSLGHSAATAGPQDKGDEPCRRDGIVCSQLAVPDMSCCLAGFGASPCCSLIHPGAPPGLYWGFCFALLASRLALSP